MVKRLVRRPHVPSWDEVDETRIVTKRIKKGTQKVRGFRVQVYSGGNTRIAHQQADKAGQKAKELFPEQPVTYISIRHVGCVLWVISLTIMRLRRLCGHSVQRVIHMPM